MNRARLWSAISGGLTLTIWAHPVLAQPPAQSCAPAAVTAIDEIESHSREWRQQAFGAFRRRLVNADLAAATPASDPVVITGGLSDDKGTAKAQAAVAFAGSGTIAWAGSLSSSNAASIDVFDPLHSATDYSTKVTIGWSYWKNVVSDAAALRVSVCDEERQRRRAQPDESPSTMTSNLVDQQKARIVVDHPIVWSVSYEIGRTTFSFADPTNDYAKAAEQHKAQAFNAAGGYVLAHGANTDKDRPITTFLMTYQRRWAYVDGSDTTQFVCHPITGSTASACDTTALPDAPPKSKPSHFVQLDIRHFFSWPISPGLRITRDATSDFNTFETPVYFISKDADTRFSFTGGVTAGYRDGGNAKGRFVAVFFGTTARPEPKAN